MNTALLDDEERSKQILGRIPANRWGSPEDFKGPVVFLASQASNYVNGEILVVDGGWMGKIIILTLSFFNCIKLFSLVGR